MWLSEVTKGSPKQSRLLSLGRGLIQLSILDYFCWRFLLCHENNISWITKLFGQFCHTPAGHTNKIDMLQFWFANMSGVFVFQATMVTDICVCYCHRITQVTAVLRYFSASFAYMNFIFHNRLPFKEIKFSTNTTCLQIRLLEQVHI